MQQLPMKNQYQKPIIVFGLTSLILAILFFTLPINLFDGIIVKQDGLQEVQFEAPLSLSYFIGLGYSEADLEGVKTFYLLPKGYLVAGILLFGIPGLLAYRIYLKATK